MCSRTKIKNILFVIMAYEKSEQRRLIAKSSPMRTKQKMKSFW
jgi:hypothetical protein